jgi:CRP/FNR family transcriptional regulator, cyclic AMP receptor protein
VNVSAEAWTRLLSSGTARFYEPGMVLLREGEPATHVLMLVAGRIKASRTSADGSVLVLGVRGPGEILGDLAVLGGERRSATITAMDRCETRIIAADRFRLLVRTLGLEPQLLRHMMARIREGEAWRAELALLASGPRLARTLARLAVPGPDGVTDISLDQAELGQAAGLSRSTVAAELARLRDLGVVTTTRRRIVVTDLPRLQILAESTHGNV